MHRGSGESVSGEKERCLGGELIPQQEMVPAERVCRAGKNHSLEVGEKP